jgi:hypothetical protein
MSDTTSGATEAGDDGPLSDRWPEGAAEIADALARLYPYRFASQVPPHGPVAHTERIGEVLAPWLRDRLAQARREGAVEALRGAADAWGGVVPVDGNYVARQLRARADEIEAGRCDHESQHVDGHWRCLRCGQHLCSARCSDG